MSKYMWHIYGNLYDSYIWLPYMLVYEIAIHLIYVVHIWPSPICCHIFVTNMLSYISKCISAYILKYYKIGRFKYVKIYVAHIWQLIWLIYLTTIYARIWDSNTFLIYVVHICPSPICCHICLTNMLLYMSKCISAYILKYYKIGRLKYMWHIYGNLYDYHICPYMR